jgi:hypothetical protein
MTAFERGWYAARQHYGDQFAAILSALPCVPDAVWAELREVWDSPSPVQRRTGSDGHHHGARDSDPSTSVAAVREHAPKWDTLNGRALRIHYNYPQGLTDWDVERLAVDYGGLGACAWKRVGELRTEYDPPLITPMLLPGGAERTRPGEHGDPRIVCQVTDAGRAMYYQMKGAER